MTSQYKPKNSHCSHYTVETSQDVENGVQEVINQYQQRGEEPPHPIVVAFKIFNGVPFPTDIDIKKPLV